MARVGVSQKDYRIITHKDGSMLFAQIIHKKSNEAVVELRAADDQMSMASLRDLAEIVESHIFPEKA